MNSSSLRSQLLLHHQLPRRLPHLVRSFAADHPWERVFNQAVGRIGLRWSLKTRMEVRIESLGDLLGDPRPSIERHASQCLRARVVGQQLGAVDGGGGERARSRSRQLVQGTPLRGDELASSSAHSCAWWRSLLMVKRPGRRAPYILSKFRTCAPWRLSGSGASGAAATAASGMSFSRHTSISCFFEDCGSEGWFSFRCRFRTIVALMPKAALVSLRTLAFFLSTGDKYRFLFQHHLIPCDS